MRDCVWQWYPMLDTRKPRNENKGVQPCSRLGTNMYVRWINFLSPFTAEGADCL